MPNSVSLNEYYPNISNSNTLYNRARGIMTPVTQTLAKGPTQYVNGVAPKYLERGKGCRVWDVDGNEYIDYNMGIGPLSLGYAYPAVDEAIRKQLEKGITFSLMSPLEVELCELIHAHIPNAEAIRISKTGCDVTSAAVRVARAFTGRDKILCCGYHGWHDWYVATTARAKGVPQAVADLTFTFNYNDLESVKKSLDANTAAVILEPVVFQEPKDNFLQEVQALCKANGTLLIFDEMWTGFRLAVGGAQEYFQITPDLACYSKAVANGAPISLLTGRREIMHLFEEEVFFFTTFGGEALSLAAALATVKEIVDKNVPKYLNEKGAILKDGYNEIAKELGLENVTNCSGYNYRSIVNFTPTNGEDPLLLKSLVQQELIRSGVLWSGFHTLSFSHTDADLEHTLAAHRRALQTLKEALETDSVALRLRGEPVQPVFRKTGDFNTKPVAR